jgi:hypothetical protein
MQNPETGLQQGSADLQVGGNLLIYMGFSVLIGFGSSLTSRCAKAGSICAWSRGQVGAGGSGVAYKEMTYDEYFELRLVESSSHKRPVSTVPQKLPSSFINLDEMSYKICFLQ